ncbi:hypothetical protein SteCoe_7397 [Stentor coeruleus]|uniref:Uncharacterized protein n=1 Tax=Stentor coeruleus TaxID=5963 RepID=A0A1R2CMP4_9CILI|nr:hypothetical protein SteCoe_7397 [Stentor coeruleus]
MSLTYNDEHSLWVQRVKKELYHSKLNDEAYYTRASFSKYGESVWKPSCLASQQKSNLTPRSETENKHESRPESKKSQRSISNYVLPEVQRPSSSNSKASDSLKNRALIPTPQSSQSKRIKKTNSQSSYKAQTPCPDLPQPKPQTPSIENRPKTHSSKSSLSKAIQESGNDSNSLKIYIRELEEILKYEQMKRIRSEEMLRQVLYK